jgi:hypothetical protein
MIPAPRNPETVRMLEQLQQNERAQAGEPELTREEFVRCLRDDIARGIIKEGLDAGGRDAAIRASGNDVDIDRRVARALETFALDDASQWSRYETPTTRWLIADICSRVETAISQRGWKLPDVPVVGTFTTGQITASTQLAENGGSLVLIDNGFFTFAHVLAQLVVFGSHDVQYRGDLTDGTVQLLSNLVATHVVAGTCLYLYRRATPAAVENLVAAYRDAIGVFVIAHEYAHVLHGDIDPHPRGGTSRSVHEAEYAADARALEIGVTATQTFGIDGAGVLGPFLFLAATEVMAQATAVYRGNSPPAPAGTAYPTPFERLQALAKWSSPPNPLSQRLAVQLRTTPQLSHLLFRIWDIIAPALAEARSDLAQFEPVLGAPIPPEVYSHGAVSALWSRVCARIGR